MEPYIYLSVFPPLSSQTVRRPFYEKLWQVDYAGQHKYTSETKFRLSERRDELKAQILK
jgi:hypothetical protein